MEISLATGGFYFENNLAEERLNLWAILLGAMHSDSGACHRHERDVAAYIAIPVAATPGA